VLDDIDRGKITPPERTVAAKKSPVPTKAELVELVTGLRAMKTIKDVHAAIDAPFPPEAD
jgi:hypothetical protein